MSYIVVSKGCIMTARSLAEVRRFVGEDLSSEVLDAFLVRLEAEGEARWIDKETRQIVVAYERSVFGTKFA